MEIQERSGSEVRPALCSTVRGGEQGAGAGPWSNAECDPGPVGIRALGALPSRRLPAGRHPDLLAANAAGRTSVGGRRSGGITSLGGRFVGVGGLSSPSCRDHHCAKDGLAGGRDHRPLLKSAPTERFHGRGWSPGDHGCPHPAGSRGGRSSLEGPRCTGPRAATSSGDAWRTDRRPHRDWRARMQGKGVVRRLLDDPLLESATPGSPFERRLLAVLVRSGIPPPVLQHPVFDDKGLIGRIDFAWRALKLGLEADGFDPHSSRKSFKHDRRRRNRLTGLGWRLVHATWDDQRRPEEIVATLKSFFP
jgi:hypothetical protein